MSRLKIEFLNTLCKEFGEIKRVELVVEAARKIGNNKNSRLNYYLSLFYNLASPNYILSTEERRLQFLQEGYFSTTGEYNKGNGTSKFVAFGYEWGNIVSGISLHDTYKSAFIELINPDDIQVSSKLTHGCDSESEVLMYRSSDTKTGWLELDLTNKEFKDCCDGADIRRPATDDDYDYFIGLLKKFCTSTIEKLKLESTDYGTQSFGK